jgi:hypothetical protein
VVIAVLARQNRLADRRPECIGHCTPGHRRTDSGVAQFAQFAEYRAAGTPRLFCEYGESCDDNIASAADHHASATAILRILRILRRATCRSAVPLTSGSGWRAGAAEQRFKAAAMAYQEAMRRVQSLAVLSRTSGPGGLQPLQADAQVCPRARTHILGDARQICDRPRNSLAGPYGWLGWSGLRRHRPHALLPLIPRRVDERAHRPSFHR